VTFHSEVHLSLFSLPGRVEQWNNEAYLLLGLEHPDTANSLNNLGELYHVMGEYGKAEPLDQEALRIRQKVIGPEHPDTANSLENLALLEIDLGRIDEATVLARQASAAQLTLLSKILSLTSEQQRLAYLDIFHPYSLFPVLKGTETDLAAAVLRYKGVVLDSIVEDRLLAEASQGSEDQTMGVHNPAVLSFATMVSA
jgi:tetratricopeptide (TPR) repeat protein